MADDKVRDEAWLNLMYRLIWKGEVLLNANLTGWLRFSIRDYLQTQFLPASFAR
jgi:hypothetical protein